MLARREEVEILSREKINWQPAAVLVLREALTIVSGHQTLNPHLRFLLGCQSPLDISANTDRMDRDDKYREDLEEEAEARGLGYRLDEDDLLG